MNKNKMCEKIFALAIFLFASGLSMSLSAQKKENPKDEESILNSSTLSGLKFRNIGPALMSGRVSDFAVNPNNHAEIYVAVASGGVWKTNNAGTTWQPIFDGQKSYSIGCITMDPSNYNVLWVGTGENNSQRSVSWGDGVYKSEDGGKSWKNMGLKTSEHIGKIIVDPRNSDVVYVAAQGPLWKSGGERGLYKTTDGGKNWELSLEISENTGVTDIVIDPRNPDCLIAAAYQRRRHVYTLINGGPESAIYKSTDAGKTWDKITNGLPQGDVGRIGLAISPVNPDFVYAIIEAADEAGGFFKSEDRGASWQKKSSYVANSPQYYQELVCDPIYPNRVYSLDTYSRFTNDGGANWEMIPADSRHVDDHALWINPRNNNHLLMGGDGGIYESFDQSKTWKYVGNFPITQFYRVAVDNTEPFYYVYGGTQDNNTQGGPSQTLSAVGIANYDWFITNGGDGFDVQIDPENPNIVYCQSQYGWLNRYDRKSGEVIGIKPMEGKDDKEPLRWNWDSPLLISPHKHSRLYFAANKLFKSEDMGNSWEAISGDLTKQLDRNTLPVMDKIWSIDAVAKNASTSQYGNIVSLTESPLKEGLIYVGTDDGLIQVTENGGESWTKYENFTGVPETTYVSCLIASKHDEGTVFASFDNHKRADFKPYLLKSVDYGKTWTSITANLPEDEPIYSIRQDHKNKDLIFVGTEYSLYVTLDGGKEWIKMNSGLPPVAIKDMEIQERENDLVLASFGRGFYILDNYSPLRTINKEFLEKEAYIFPIEDALMYVQKRDIGWGKKGYQGDAYYTADNPPFGATFTYYLKESVKSLKQDRKDKEKELIKEGKAVPYPSKQEILKEAYQEDAYLLFIIKDEDGQIIRKLRAPASKGVHRITWDLTYASTYPVYKNSSNDQESGMPVAPGKYTVELQKIVNGEANKLVEPTSFNAIPLNNTTLPAKDMAALSEFRRDVAELSRISNGVIRMARDLGEKAELMEKASKLSTITDNDLMKKVLNLKENNRLILKTLTGESELSKHQIESLPTISDRIGNITWGMWRSTSAPTKTMKDSYAIAKELLKTEHTKLKTLLEKDLIEIEKALERANAPYTPGRLPEWDID